MTRVIEKSHCDNLAAISAWGKSEAARLSMAGVK
jgi:hypothetical protein